MGLMLDEVPTIAGIPPKELVDGLTRSVSGYDHSTNIRSLAAGFRIPASKAERLFDTFLVEGVLEQRDGQSYLSDLGLKIWNARTGKRFNRKVAEKLIAKVQQRCIEYNRSDPNNVKPIQKVVVYGSYLDPDCDALGDLDVAFTLFPNALHSLNMTEKDEILVAENWYTRAGKEHRHLLFVNIFSGPERHARKVIKGGSPRVKPELIVGKRWEPDSQNGEAYLIYDASADVQAIKRVNFFSVLTTQRTAALVDILAFAQANAHEVLQTVNPSAEQPSLEDYLTMCGVER